MIKILTLNTWQERGPWRERWEIIFEEIQKIQPDLIGFQEVFNPEWTLEIKNRLGYPCLYYPCSPSGLLTLSKHPILESNYQCLATKSPTEDYQRYVTMTRIETRNQSICFFNTHLSWRPEESPVREAQVQEIAEWMKIAAPQSSWILVGDMNSVASSPEIKYLIDTIGLADSFSTLHPENPGLTWDNRNKFAASAHHKLPDRRIDYILTCGKNKTLGHLSECRLVLTETTNTMHASDHFGILATFEEK